MRPSSGDLAGAVRVGGIDYLNALPLTRYLRSDGTPPLVVSEHVPGVLAEKLRAGDLDIALVPVVEYLAREEYRIVPGVSISSYGEVRSIRFFHRKDLAHVRFVGLDECSRTSAALTRLLFHDLWKARPEFAQVSPAEGLQAIESDGGPEAWADLDGVLLIGDAALAARPQPGWESIDLGTAWTRWTGLPLVYAFWVWRGGSAPPGLAGRFLDAKTEGVSRIDDIVREYCSHRGGDPVFCRHYLSRTIQYDLDAVHAEGFLEYARRLELHKLLPRTPRSAASGREMLQWLEESPSPPA